MRAAIAIGHHGDEVLVVSLDDRGVLPRVLNSVGENDARALHVSGAIAGIEVLGFGPQGDSVNSLAVFAPEGLVERLSADGILGRRGLEVANLGAVLVSPLTIVVVVVLLSLGNLFRPVALEGEAVLRGPFSQVGKEL